MRQATVSSSASSTLSVFGSVIKTAARIADDVAKLLRGLTIPIFPEYGALGSCCRVITPALYDGLSGVQAFALLNNAFLIRQCEHIAARIVAEDAQAKAGGQGSTQAAPGPQPPPRADLERDVTRQVEPSPELHPALMEVYRCRPDLAEVCERLVDLDEGLMEWRYRHVKMVQRTIGTRRGTGGSAGAEYLMTTLNHPLYPDLWAIRTEL